MAWKVLNIAHRGASSLAPENTIIAFEKAAELLADAGAWFGEEFRGTYLRGSARNPEEQNHVVDRNQTTGHGRSIKKDA